MPAAWSLDHLVGAGEQRRRHGEYGASDPALLELDQASREVADARHLLRLLGRCHSWRDGETTSDGADERAARNHRTQRARRPPGMADERFRSVRVTEFSRTLP